MAVAMVSYADSRSEYESVSVLDPRPDGLLAHAASELPDGRVQILDIWESKEAGEAFTFGVLFPAFEKAGQLAQITAGEQPVAYETFDLIV